MNCPYTPSSNSAVTALNASQQPDPSAFYQAACARPGLHFDAGLQLWLAAEPATVRSLLEHPGLGVRPPDEAVPQALQGRPFGTVFGRWLRMRDDAGHADQKAALHLALAAWPVEQVQAHAEAASRLAAQGGPRHWQWASLPCTLAGLLGLKLPDLAAQRQLLRQLGSWAAALKPQASIAALDAADATVHALAALDAQQLALLWQSYEAGAGLLGNAWLAGTAPDQLPPPVNHTRRYALRGVSVAGRTLPRGATLLLMLVAEPALGYGHGRHACPGRALAQQIAEIALRHAPPCPRSLQLGYLPVPNARIPTLPY